MVMFPYFHFQIKSEEIAEVCESCKKHVSRIFSLHPTVLMAKRSLREFPKNLILAKSGQVDTLSS